MVGVQNPKTVVPKDDLGVIEKNFMYVCLYTYLKIQQYLLIFGQKTGFVMAKFFILTK